jgi:hypothetical protein
MIPTHTDDEETESNPITRERINSFLKAHKFKILAVLLFVIGLGIWFCLPSSKSIISKEIDRELEIDRLKKERDQLKIKMQLNAIESLSLSNNISELLGGNEKLINIIVSNKAFSSSTSLPTSSAASVATVVQSAPTPITVENPNKFDVGLVTVNGNGDVTVNIDRNGSQESERVLQSPDKAEDIISGTKPIGAEPIKKVIPPKGNGIRYYIPSGWSVDYVYYCSEKDFKVYLNRGTRRIPIWKPVSVSDDGISESIWIKNTSSRSIELIFTLTPAKE